MTFHLLEGLYSDYWDSTSVRNVRQLLAAIPLLLSIALLFVPVQAFAHVGGDLAPIENADATTSSHHLNAKADAGHKNGHKSRHDHNNSNQDCCHVQANNCGSFASMIQPQGQGNVYSTSDIARQMLAESLHTGLQPTPLLHPPA